MKNSILLATLLFLIVLAYPSAVNATPSKGPGGLQNFTENRGQLCDQNGKPRNDIRYYGSDGALNYYISNQGISYQLTKRPQFENNRNTTGGSHAIEALVWGTYYGGQNFKSHNFYNLKLDGSGNIYACGRTNATAGMTTAGAYQTVMNGIDDGILAKFSTNGARIWSTYYGGNQTDAVQWLALDGSALYIAGFTTSTNNLSTAGAWQTAYSDSIDCFLARFDTTGMRQWGAFVGGPKSDHPSGLVVGPSGDVYLAGDTKSPSGISTAGAFQSNLNGVWNMFLSRFSSGGTILWSTYYGNNTGIVEAEQLIMTTDGNLIALGSTHAYGLGTAGSWQRGLGGVNDGLMVSFSPSGSHLWTSYFGDSGQEYITGGSADQYNGFYISGTAAFSGGTAATSGTHQQTIAGDGDAFLNRFINCNDLYESIQPITCDAYTSPSGNAVYTASGIYLDTVSTPNGCKTYYNIQLTVQQPVDTGVIQAGFQLTAVNSGASYQWINCSNGTPVAGAVSQLFNPASNGSYAVVVTKNGCTDTSSCYNITGIGVQEFALSEVNVYPNPSAGLFTLELSEVTDIEVRVEDLTGRLILSKKYDQTNRAQLRLDAAMGVYLLMITTPDDEWTRWIIVSEK